MYYITNEELYHHGIKGQRWGIRRYQNPDGTLTDEGKVRYNDDSKFKEKYDKYEQRSEFWKSKKGKAVKAGVIAASILAAYGTTKLRDHIISKKEVNSVLEPWFKNNAEKIRVNQLNAYKDDFYQNLSDNFKKTSAQERFDAEIKKGAKEIKNLTKELSEFKGKYRIAKIKDKINPNMFGDRTQFMTNPLERWMRVNGYKK